MLGLQRPIVDLTRGHDRRPGCHDGPNRDGAYDLASRQAQAPRAMLVRGQNKERHLASLRGHGFTSGWGQQGSAAAEGSVAGAGEANRSAKFGADVSDVIERRGILQPEDLAALF